MEKDMKRYVLMIVALFIAALNLRPAINSVAPLLETIRNDLGMSGSTGSLLTSIPVLCMGLFSPLAVKLSGRWGIERVLGWSLFVIGVGTVLRLFTYSSFFLLLTAFIAGVGIAAAGPLLSGFIKRHFPKHVPTMISVYTVALSLGAALSSSLTALLENGMKSWQIALGVWAVIAIIAVPLWKLFVTRHHKHQPNHSSTGGAKVRLPWKNHKAWMLTLSFGFMAMLFYSFTAWLPQIIQGMGYSKAYAASVLTIFVIVQIPVSLMVSVVLRKFPSRRLWLVVEALLVLIGILMIMLSAEPWIAAIFLGLGAGGLFPLNLLLPLDATDSAPEAAAWSAMIQSVGYVIGATGPFILGWIHDATNSFFSAIVGLMAINLAMIVVQIAATANRQRSRNSSRETSKTV